MSTRKPAYPKAHIAAFNRTLFSFYRKEGRKMPWRETTNPYHILVSEIMLQQTQVDRVRVKYKEFLRRFPTLRTLADASLGDVLRVWSGLGYNRRAKYLHECAKVVVRAGGTFPKTMEVLVQLPGIGRSTAAGVMAFAWNLPEPMIDTNIRRVLNRVFFPKKQKTDRELYDFAQELIPPGRGREWNYAMLDLAAMKCTARHHAHDCPLTVLHGPIHESSRKPARARFIDTDRFARGRIITALGESRRGLSLATLTKKTEREEIKTKSLLTKLMHEGLVAKYGALYKLP